jgi:hypothetical protein
MCQWIIIKQRVDGCSGGGGEDCRGCDPVVVGTTEVDGVAMNLYS